VRVVAATHRDLREQIAQGRFREDLYARIESPQILVPPLRERRSDIPSLFLFFLGRRAQEHARQLRTSWEHTAFASLWREASAHPPPIPVDLFFWMLGHDWPRNVRELDKFAAEVAASIIQGRELPSPPRRSPPPPRNPAFPPAPPSGFSPAAPAVAPAPAPPLAEPDARGRPRPDRVEIERALEENNFNQTDAARAIGVPYATLDRWMRELGVVRPKDLSREDILAAWHKAGGDTPETAHLLRVSLRGLKVRMKELGIE
jgi:DNA-binding NtrC family response regulator